MVEEISSKSYEVIVVYNMLDAENTPNFITQNVQFTRVLDHNDYVNFHLNTLICHTKEE